MKEVFSKTFIF